MKGLSPVRPLPAPEHQSDTFPTRVRCIRLWNERTMGGRNIRGKAARSSASLVRMSERVVSRHQATDASLFRMSLPKRAGPLPMSLSSSGHILGVVEQERTTCSTSPKRVAEAVRLTFWKTLRCSGWSSLRRHRTSAQIAADVTCFGLAEDRPRSPREHDGNA